MSNHLAIKSDGTRFGTEVFLPNGNRLKCTSVKLELEVREAEKLTITFYASKELWLKCDGTQENGGTGLYLSNGKQLQGVCALAIPTTIEQDSDQLITATVYPFGSIFGVEKKAEAEIAAE